MLPEKVCNTCELYLHCMHYGELPPNEQGCKGWEASIGVFSDLSDTEQKILIYEKQTGETIPKWLKNYRGKIKKGRG